MSRRLVQYIEYTDDLDKTSKADQTGVVLGWKGKLIALDLTQDHYEQLEAFMEPLLKAAHHDVKLPKDILEELTRDPLAPAPVKRVKAARNEKRSLEGGKQLALEESADTQRKRSAAGEMAKSKAVPDKELRQKIRAWARENGMPVGLKGILPTAATEAYLAAHGMTMEDVQKGMSDDD